MVNTQSKIDSMKELNSKLLVEITNLRKENAEIPELRKKFSEVEAENIELKAENVKLKQALEEHESRFAKLEQNDKDTAVENAELKARVAKLEQKQSKTDEKNNFIVKSDDDAKVIDQSLVNSTSNKIENSNITEQIVPQCDDTPATNISDITSNSDIYQDSVISTSSAEIKSLEDKMIDETLDEAHKKRVSDSIRQRKHEEKLKRESVIQDVSSDLSHNKETVNDQDPKLSHDTEIVNDQDLKLPRGEKTIANIIDEQVQKGITDSTIDSNLSHDTKTVNNVNDDSKLSHDTETINNISQEHKSITNSTEDLTLMNEFVQGLLQDFTSHNNQCWESIELTSPTSISENLQKLAHLFYQASIARKNSINTKREEILSWGRYSERYEDKVIEFRSGNKKLTDKSARNRIYNEMRSYLPGISDGYLRVMTCKARKINKLFGYEYDPVTLKKIKGIGWYMVNRITCSADSISRLTNPQIRYIIDYVTSKTVNNVNDQNCVTLETTEKALSIPQIAPAKVDDDDGFDKILMEAFEEEEADNDKDFYNSEEEYNFGRVFSDNNNDEVVSLHEGANTTRDNENDDEFSDNNEEEDDDGGFCGFSDDDDEGYYYDLNTGETYTKSEHRYSIRAY